MGVYGPALYDDAALIAEIQAYQQARRKIVTSGIGVIAGENRRLEFTSRNVPYLDAELREMLAEARNRGLDIGGGAPGAIAVEFH